MKKGLLFLVILLVLPVVQATISIDGPTRYDYNIGDKVEINGYIVQTESFQGLFNLNLNCNSSLQLLVKSIALDAEEKYDFSENLLIPTFLDGTCNIKAELATANGTLIEEASSRNFIITKELNGTFRVDETKIQIGKDIFVNGNVFKLSGENVNGVATLYFKKDDVNYFIDTIKVVEGNFRYTHSSSGESAGFYIVDIDVNDLYGNQQLFENIGSFTLVGELYVIAKPDKLHVLPGSSVNIFGEAKTILQEKVGKGTVSIILNENKYETDLRKSKFSYDLEIPKNIETGKHKVVVRVEDLIGNKGQTDTSIYVDAVATRLANEFNQESFKPEEIVSIIPLLYDQADSLMIEEISVEISNPRKQNIFSGVTQSNEKIEFTLPSSSVPGTYIVKTYAAGLSYEDQIYIEEFARVEFALDNQTLYIKNTGNIRYKKPIEIGVKSLGESYTIIKKTPIGVNQSLTIDLGEEVPSGKYTVIAGNSTFKDVVVVGRPKKDYSWLYYIIIAAAVVLFFLFFSNRIKKEIKKRKLRPRRRLKLPRILPGGKKESVKEFRERVLKDVEEAERKKTFKFKPKETYEEVIIEKPKEEPKAEEEPEEEKREIVIEKPEEKEKEKEKKKEKEGLFKMFD